LVVDFSAEKKSSKSIKMLKREFQKIFWLLGFWSHKKISKNLKIFSQNSKIEIFSQNSKIEIFSRNSKIEIFFSKFKIFDKNFKILKNF
jgi:hypothetical protein